MKTKRPAPAASIAPSSAMPSADEIIAAFDVPEHRRSEVRASYEEYLTSVDKDIRQKGRQPSNLLESIYVPSSRSHCATADRIKSLGRQSEDLDYDAIASSAVATMISRGRWRLLLEDAGTGGAVAIAGSLRKLPNSIENLGAHVVAAAILDLVTEPDAGDEDVSDEAAGWTLWLETVLSENEPDEVDRNDLDDLDAMLGASGIDIREVSSMMTATLALVDAHGHYVAPAKGHEAAIDHVWSQMTMQEILDHALADPAATERHEERLERRRAERAAERDFRAMRRANQTKIDMPAFPGLAFTI